MAGNTEISDMDVVSKETMQFVSKEISTQWKAFGRYLGVRDAKLDNIQADNLLSQQEQVYKMLLSWAQAKGNDATYDILFKALISVERGALIEEIERLRVKKKKSNDGVSSSVN